VPHDAEPTFAFRFDAGYSSLGFASDVGHVTPALEAAFDGVTALAVEFNHDVRMQRASGRPQLLIDRVLGKYGHLSNAQAAAFAADLDRAAGLKHLVQLHLSRECNTPELAAKAGRAAVSASTNLVTASQYQPTSTLVLDGPPRRVTRPAVQRALPGLELDESAA
jgi:phosphoribosyl 1,2-cyclic phosphodiesterase